MLRLLGFLLPLALAFPPASVLASEFRLLQIDGYFVKWGAPAFGAGAEVTYGFVTEAESFPDAINCGEMAPMDVLSAVWGHNDAALEQIAADAFAMWSAAARIEFRRAGPGERPDILIGTQAKPRRIAFANVWHEAEAAAGGIAPLTAATICFNPEAAWVAEDVGPEAGETALDLRTVLAHEIGHAIGLGHPGPTGSLMAFQPQGTVERLTPGDVEGGLTLYGARASR